MNAQRLNAIAHRRRARARTRMGPPPDKPAGYTRFSLRGSLEGRGRYMVNSKTQTVYKIVSTEPIGIGEDNIPVYKVQRSVPPELYNAKNSRVEPEFFAVKRVTYYDHNSIKPFSKLLRKVTDDHRHFPWDHPYLMQANSYFVDQEIEALCVVMPFPERGSLRTIMADRFPYGFSESCIVVILRAVLEALRTLHSVHFYHGKINAGNVYVKNGPRIMLGFGATIYEHGVLDMEPSTSSWLPAEYISEWGSAPEVFNRGVDDQFSKAADIWLVGILALELAYGGLRLPSREALEMMVEEIGETDSLPKCFQVKERKEEVVVEGKGKKKIEKTPGELELEERAFSREFEILMIECLEWEAEYRPSAKRFLEDFTFFSYDGLKMSDFRTNFQNVTMQKLGKVFTTDSKQDPRPSSHREENRGISIPGHESKNDRGISIPGHASENDRGVSIPGHASENDHGISTPGHASENDRGISIPGPASENIRGISIPGHASENNRGISIPGHASDNNRGISIPGPASENNRGISNPGPASDNDRGISIPGRASENNRGISIPGPASNNDRGISIPSPASNNDRGISIPGHASENDHGISIPGSASSDVKVPFKVRFKMSHRNMLPESGPNMRDENQEAHSGVESGPNMMDEDQEAHSSVESGPNMMDEDQEAHSSVESGPDMMDEDQQAYSRVESWIDEDFPEVEASSSSHRLKSDYLVDRENLAAYKIISKDPIGTDSDNIPVYVASYSECVQTPYDRTFIERDIVSVKITDTTANLKGHMNLCDEIEKRNKKLRSNHENLMQVDRCFGDANTLDYCVVMPFAEWGSLRSIMADYFPDGLPESCISVVLRSVLRALSFLHQQNVVHREINAGHVYVTRGPKIKLGFAATIYELGKRSNIECSSSSALPETDICNWAAAPEVYDHNLYSEKANIWLVGITALELAYGGIRVPNREALMMMIEEITKTMSLPKNYPVTEKAEKGDDDKKKDDKGKKKMDSEEETDSSERSFSREFEWMVAECLAWNPVQRPTTTDLLQHAFFVEDGIDSSELDKLFVEIMIQICKK